MSDTAVPDDEDRRLSGRLTCEEIMALHERIETGAVRMTRIENSIIAHRADTAEILEVVQLWKSFFKVFDWIASGIKYIGGSLAAAVALYYLFKGK